MLTAACLCTSQAGPRCVWALLSGARGHSWIWHVQLGALCLECQCERSGRTGLTVFTMSLHVRDLSGCEIIAYGLQRNISAVALLSL